MHVLRLVHRLPPAPGGKEVHAKQLSQALYEEGVFQTVFYSIGDPIPGLNCVRVAAAEGDSSNRELMRFARSAYREAIKLNSVNPFDLVHAHGDFVEAGLAALISRKIGVPAVLTVHGGLSQKVSHNRLRIAAFSAMEQIIAVSQGVKDQIRQIGVSAAVEVVPSGVRDEFFTKPLTSEKKYELISVGRISPVKGFDLLLDAKTLVDQQLVASGNRLPWLIVGDGHDDFAQQVKDRILQTPGVERIATNDPQELARLLAQSQIFVQPSLELAGQREGTPTAVMEALAGGVPVIASDAAGLPADDSRITQFAAGSAEALATALVKCLRGEAETADATASVVKLPVRDWTQVASLIKGIYREAVTRHQQPAELLTVAWLEIGGAERMVLDLAEDAQRNGSRVLVAAAPGNLVGELPAGVEFCELRRGVKALPHNAWALTGAMIRSRPRSLNPHHFPTGVSAVVAKALAGSFKTQRALTVHVPERRASSALIGLVAPRIFDLILPVADTVSNELKQSALTSGAKNKFVTSHIGVGDGSRPATDPQAINAQAITSRRKLGIVARLVERKGHKYLFEAWDQLADLPGCENWDLEIWGDGPLRSELESLVAKSKFADRIFLRGSVAGARNRLHELDLVVLPSLREGLPLMLVEAMAAGVPCAASALPGCVELAGQPPAIQLFEAGSSSAIVDALKTLMADPERLQQLAEQGALRHRSEFTRKRMSDDYRRMVWTGMRPR